MPDKEFKVNEYIALRLEGGKTNIYLKGELFQHCKSLLQNIPTKRIISIDGVVSIDEITEKLVRKIAYTQKIKIIPPELEFWGHCSSLQAWVEHNYNTNLIHSSLGFPLLKGLVDIGDPLAKKVFKGELIKRFRQGNENVVLFLLNAHYLDNLDLNPEEHSLISMKCLSLIENLISDYKKRRYQFFDDFLEEIERLVPYLNQSDANYCFRSTGLNLIGNIITFILDIDDYYYKISYEDFLDTKTIKDNFGEYIEKSLINIISLNDSKKNEVIAHLGLFKHLNEDTIENLLNFHEFYDTFKNYLSNVDPSYFNSSKVMKKYAAILKQFLKKKISKILSEGSIKELFMIWDEQLFKDFTTKEIFSLLKDRKLKLLENYLKVLHYLFSKGLCSTSKVL